jgi:deoxyribodipyrimidine photo-lyase
MNRDQRVQDNWALLAAQEESAWDQSGLAVCFCLVPEFLHATWRHYAFLLAGLREVEQTLADLNIPFFLLIGNPAEELPRLIQEIDASVLVTDFLPLRIKTSWESTVAAGISTTFIQVDAHNIVPCRAASPKQEFGAYTLRPKLNNLLPRFLDEFPPVSPQSPANFRITRPPDWKAAEHSIRADHAVKPISGFQPGPNASMICLKGFIKHALNEYDSGRNDPNLPAQSGLSPYLHFGHCSAQRVALEIMKSTADPDAKAAFLEELIVRRELSDNFCFYNPHYDTPEGFPEWARITRQKHDQDPREMLYSLETLEKAQTHDELWNAAQRQMVISGKMHGFLRMYWGKKILEWSENTAIAHRWALLLNDRYELDGRDPNGYAGVAWSIGGVHDRAWGERPVFGKIRYMNFQGCRRKFDVAAFVKAWS